MSDLEQRVNDLTAQNAALSQAHDALVGQLDQLRELLAGGVTTQALSVGGEARFGNDVIIDGALKTGGEIRGTIEANSVGTNQLAIGAVVAAKIADKAVVTGKIADKAVDSGKIADKAVVSGKIADKAVGLSNLDAATVKATVTDHTTAIAKLAASQLKCHVATLIFGANDTVLPVLPATKDVNLGSFGTKVVAITVTPTNNVASFEGIITAIPIPSGNKAIVRMARSTEIQVQVNFCIFFTG